MHDEKRKAYQKAYSKAYYKAHAEELKAYGKAYSKAYREARAEKLKAYRAAHRVAAGPDLVAPQPAPEANGRPAVWSLVLADMAARDQEGRRKYGVPLQPHNGRDPLIDAYQEALDLCAYLRQAIYERGGQ